MTKRYRIQHRGTRQYLMSPDILVVTGERNSEFWPLGDEPSKAHQFKSRAEAKALVRSFPSGNVRRYKIEVAT